MKDDRPVGGAPNRATHISVIGAQVHNLKDLHIELPRDQLTVITGLSGSGKSSLAFDTIYQEGQRRYMESLSAYARQFLGKMVKPQVQRIEGLSPTLCIDQKTVNRNPRSTVGTITEILDHLRLLMARLGTPHCPECDRVISTLSPPQIRDGLLRDWPQAKLHVLAPIVVDRKGEYRKELGEALADGFVRARIDGAILPLDSDIQLARYEKHTIELVVDRIRVRPERTGRLLEAIEQALKLTAGLVSFCVEPVDEAGGTAAMRHHTVSAQRSCPEHAISLPEMEPRLFSFNAPQGMCEHCGGIGWLEDFDLDLLIDAERPFDEAFGPLRTHEHLPFSSLDRGVIQRIGKQLGVRANTRWRSLQDKQVEALLFGADLQYKVTKKRRGRTSTSQMDWRGLQHIIRHVWHFTRLKRLAPYRRRVQCPLCEGRRLNPLSLAVLFHEKNIHQLVSMPVRDARAFFEAMEIEGPDARIGMPIIRELRTRLRFLSNVGLGYLTLDRSAATLSGGEGQRIRLASQVGTALQGVTYVLDEPSIGVHPRDQQRLLDALLELRDRGNTVLVVEHDADTMARADFLVEIGPGAGSEGGEVVACGSPSEFWRSEALTARYLRGQEAIPLPDLRRAVDGHALVLEGASGHNLTGVDVRFPLGTLTAITGVSGSGKSTLVVETLCRALEQELHGAKKRAGPYKALQGSALIEKVIRINQAPIGRTPRSNPATYTDAWTHVRALFAQVQESRVRGYTKGRFSFNVAGGRCEACSGAGVKTVEMQFLADVVVSCEVCQGSRFNPETLEIRYRGRNIAEMLQMRISKAAEFFKNHRRLHRILSTLEAVGLGYVALGQPSTTLSGGEAQRIKLAAELHRPSSGKTLYVLDEPTTGLHMQDVGRLLVSLNRLVDAGNTVLVIEHNTDVIKVADHVIDLGPEGGDGGGCVVGIGTPEEISLLQTPTGEALHKAMAPTGVSDVPPPEFTSKMARPSAKEHLIRLRGVETHNLKNVDVDLPEGKMTVITGPSGSGKTSLAFDTLFTLGQRQYVESLSTYARRFLGRLQRPPVRSAEGLAPAIAIDQRNRSHNPRSTVATVTEIYDTFRLLFARIGQPHCPHCNERLAARPPSAAAVQLKAGEFDAGWVLADLSPGFAPADLLADGFTRYWLDGQQELSALVDAGAPEDALDGCSLVIDRFKPSETSIQRMAEAISLAYGYGSGRARFVDRHGVQLVLCQSTECTQHGKVLPLELTPRHFSFNSHVGACSACAGLGKRIETDPQVLLPNPSQPLQKALDKRVSSVLYRSARNRTLIAKVFELFNTNASTPVDVFSPELRRAVLYGMTQPLSIAYSRQWGRNHSHIEEERIWPGIVGVVDRWQGKNDWLRRSIRCSACLGGRLQPAASAVTVGEAGVTIAKACVMTVDDAVSHWGSVRLGPEETLIGEQAIADLLSRLRFLQNVGLGYLGLDRPAESLSGGESQRIRLASQLGTRLTGSIYVLDEPTIGLHPRDTQRLLGTLDGLVELGNSVVVVEHDPMVIWAAHHVIDMGPGAGEHGGEIVAQGSPEQVACSSSLTGAFLSGERSIAQRAKVRKPASWIKAPATSLHNLKDVAVRLPRGCLCVVTGVSGSGKSTLIMDAFAPWLDKAIKSKKSNFPERLVVVDQRPIGRTPRSTPASYTKVLGPIRTLFSQTQLARTQGFAPGRFSYNHRDGGRCRMCEGRGSILVEMHFLSDVWVPCEHCGGARFEESTLAVQWKGHSIADVLSMPIRDALALFSAQKAIARRLQALADVGLGYLRLGQPATTLSGGETQRLKLACELVSRPRETCFLLDEPTTGLHLADVEKLLGVLHRLVDQGHMVVVVEHHLDVIKNADHVIDLGPEGGICGGEVVVSGPPHKVRKHPTSWTGRALRAE